MKISPEADFSCHVIIYSLLALLAGYSSVSIPLSQVVYVGAPEIFSNDMVK